MRREPRVTAKVAQAYGRARSRRVIARKRHDDRIAAEFGPLKLGIAPARHVGVLLRESDVVLAEHHCGQRALGLHLEQLDAHVRMSVLEQLERRRDQGQQRRLQRGQLEATVNLTRRVLQFGLCLLETTEQHTGVLDQAHAGVGQSQPATDPLGQGHARLALQLRKLLAHRAGRVRERLGNRRDRATGAELPQQHELSHIEHR